MTHTKEQYNARLIERSYPPLPDDQWEEIEALSARRTELLRLSNDSGSSDEAGMCLFKIEQITRKHCDSYDAGDRAIGRAQHMALTVPAAKGPVVVATQPPSAPPPPASKPESLSEKFLRLKAEETCGRITAGSARAFWRANRQAIDKEQQEAHFAAQGYVRTPGGGAMILRYK